MRTASMPSDTSKDLFLVSRRQKNVMVFMLSVAALFWLLPLYTVVFNSLKVGGLGNYAHVISQPVNGVPFWRYFFNSTIIAVTSSLLVVSVAAMAGFAFSKIQFAGRELVFNAVVMCLAISASVIYIPMFFILKNLHLYNTYFAVILPEVTLTLPFGVLLMKNYFDALPTSLLESATLDGANPWQVFVDIYLPMAKPAVINLGVLQIMWSFQDFFLPLMFLTKKELFPATIAINVFRGMFGSVAADMGYLNAALVLIGIPSILVFVLAEKYITKGITSGALKE